MATKEDLSEWEIAPTKKMYGYGFGYIIVNYLLLYGLSSMDYFYRVAIGISAELILVAMIIFAIWNMINDPLLGYLTDRPMKWTKKWGLRAPWIVLMTAPMFICFILIWTVPKGANDTTKFIYMVVIVCIFDMFFSIYNDHLYGGYTNQFPSKFERRKSFMLMTVMLFITLIVMSVIQSRIVGEGETAQEPYILNAIVMVVLLIIFTIPTIKLGIGESEEMKSMFIEKYESADKASFFEVVKTALKTKNFRVSLLGYTVQVTATTLWNAAQIYFFVDVYGGSLSQQQLPLLLSIIAAIASIPFWSNFTRKGNFKRTYWVAFLLHGLTFLPFLAMLAIPFGSSTFTIMHTIFLFIMNIFYAGEVTMLMPVASDTYDEVALKLGKRSDATFVGLRNFFFRMAFLVQAFVFFIVLTLVNYDPTPFAIQTETAKVGILIMGAVIPCILFVVMSLLFRKNYTLVGKEKDDMVKGLKEAGLY
ncbi:MAG: MFS transporter [Candidatus Hodarchaeales archaeon]|jgi:GPH family glycoside/pentoside/hexuronide:cation symporter